MFHRRTLRLALVASLLAVVAACGGGTPAAPALTDPNEILAESMASLKDVKTVEFTGGLTGSIKAEGLGDFDLSSATLNGALDIPGKKAKFSFKAPTLLNSEVDALLVDDAAYYRLSGALAMIAGGASDKYIKTEVSDSGGTGIGDDADVDAQIDEFKEQLGKLPNAPTKEADERCGDQDCYHIRIQASAADLGELSPDAAAVGDGDMTIDLWVRKNDLRPGKLALAVSSTQTGNIGVTLEFKYDVSVTVEAPPADQVQS